MPTVPVCNPLVESATRTTARKKEEKVSLNKISAPIRRYFATGAWALFCLMSFLTSQALCQDRSKPETIDATATGTQTEAGKEFDVTLVIYQYSTPADRRVLVEAFQKGKNEGLYNALSKMKAVSHIAITGTLGYDVSYIRLIPTPTGRKLRFVTNRLLRFGELYWDTLSASYNLTAGELNLDDQDKTKSTGVLYPAAEFAMDKLGTLQINLIGSPWKLSNIIDWSGSPAD